MPLQVLNRNPHLPLPKGDCFLCEEEKRSVLLLICPNNHYTDYACKPCTENWINANRSCPLCRELNLKNIIDSPILIGEPKLKPASSV